MIDSTSIHAFMNSLPSKNDPALETLELKFRVPGKIPAAAVALTKRGYLGCFPLAQVGSDDILIRLYPQQEIQKSPLALLWKSIPEGLTFAPDLEHFTAGRMAQMDVTGRPGIDDPQKQRQLMNFADQFGSAQSCRNILDHLEDARQKGPYSRSGYLWEIADPDNAFFNLLSKLWTPHNLDAGTKAWIRQAFQENPENDIILRLYVSLSPWVDDKIDLTDALTKLLHCDDRFDQGYQAISTGLKLHIVESAPLVEGIASLKNASTPPPLPADLWAAAQAYAAKPLKYDGTLHLNFAKSIAEKDPRQAYLQTCNAALYASRATRKPPVEALQFAYELAKTNAWPHLETVLGWAVEELKPA